MADLKLSGGKAVGTGGAGGLAPPPPIFFSKVKVPFFNNHINTFYLAWHKVKSCFRCIPSKIMIKFACSIMGKAFLAILEGLKLKCPPGSSALTMVGPSLSLTYSALVRFGPFNVEQLRTALGRGEGVRVQKSMASNPPPHVWIFSGIAQCHWLAFCRLLSNIENLSFKSGKRKENNIL